MVLDANVLGCPNLSGAERNAYRRALTRLAGADHGSTLAAWRRWRSLNP